MKQRVDKVDHFWDGLTVRKTSEDREFQRKVVLGADALVSAICKGIMRGILIAFALFILLAAVAQWQKEHPAQISGPPQHHSIFGGLMTWDD
jgi:hypothetical protein